MIRYAVGDLTINSDGMWDEEGDRVVWVKERTLPPRTAYEIAVDRGFPGTEEQWIDYMRRPHRWVV